MDDEDERSMGSPGSQDGDGDNDETMQDIDGEDDERQDDEMDEGDEDGDGDGDGDDDNEGENEDDANESENDDQNQEEQPTQEAEPSATQAVETDTKKPPDFSHPRPEVLTASTYDIVPTIAAPQSTSINCITGTSDSRWIFTGGADGYIRQYNWVESVNGRTQLTVAQRHPFVDSVQKAGVLVTYWENYDAKRLTPESTISTTSQSLSPVYSLACQGQALWMVAGTASGAIRLQTVRHDEGHQIALLQKHTSAVSVLHLSSDERSLLSGSWDKTVVDWDLEVGKVRTAFASSGGQISCIESRPISSVPVPFESGEVIKASTTLSTNNASEGINGFTNGAVSSPAPGQGTPPDSLFGEDDGDDLFGDSADAGLSNGNAFGFDESEMNQTVEDAPAPENGGGTDIEPISTAPAVQPPGSPPKVSTTTPEPPATNGVPNSAPQALANGLPHAEDLEQEQKNSQDPELEDKPVTSDSTFLATSTDGSIRVWDRRQPLPVARITPFETPPWCLSACWSPDGNNLYAGRRNNAVEEYDLRKGLKKPERIFRFPQGSGAVTCVKAMPNQRHLICASYDILRLYDLKHSSTNRSSVPFLIVPGHRTGTISTLYLSADCRYMMSTGGNRGWEGSPTEVLLGYEVGVPRAS